MSKPEIIHGEISAISYPGVGTPAQVVVWVKTAKDVVRLIFQGRETIACMNVGMNITARIVPLEKKGARHAFNPRFTLEPEGFAGGEHHG